MAETRVPTFTSVNQHTTLSTVFGNTNKLELLNIITYFAVQKESKLIFSLTKLSVPKGPDVPATL